MGRCCQVACPGCDHLPSRLWDVWLSLLQALQHFLQGPFLHSKKKGMTAPQSGNLQAQAAMNACLETSPAELTLYGGWWLLLLCGASPAMLADMAALSTLPCGNLLAASSSSSLLTPGHKRKICR